MKKIFFTLTFLSFLFSFSFSQSELGISLNIKSNENKKTEQARACFENESENSIGLAEDQAPFEALKCKREDLNKRDAYSKHYINNDGSYTAIVGVDPMHYLNSNKEWKDISHRILITSNPDYKFANTTNILESHFGTQLQNGIISKTAEGTITEFLNPKMYWEVNGQAVQLQTANNVAVSVNNDKAVYKNIFGNISAEYTILTGKRKLNYIIPSLQALGNIPNQTEYLVFTEDIELPENWTATMGNRGIIIKNEFGKEVCMYENPYSTDAGSNELIVENTIYEIVETGNIITVKTKVKASWLLSQERVFPVNVDPTVNVWGNTTGAVASNGSFVSFSARPNDIVSGIVTVGGYNREIRGYARFDISSIPAGSTVSSAVATTRIYYNDTWQDNGHVWGSCRLDPATADGIQVYNQAELDVTVYWVGLPYAGGTNGTLATQTLNAAARSDIENSLTQGWFAMVMFPTGSYWDFNYPEYLELWGQRGGTNPSSTNHRPFLKITYTPLTSAPACATLTDATTTTNVLHQGLQISWKAVKGATSYDLYFGETNPPSFLQNQTTTTYSITNCLPPNKTYYWKVVPRNSYGAASGCPTWSFKTDNKLVVYKNDFESSNTGYFGTSGVSVDGWYTNTHEGITDYFGNLYSNIWTVGDGYYAVSGKSAGLSGTYNWGLGGNFFQYWVDFGETYRWIYRPFDFTGLRDIGLNFRWRCSGESGQDYGNIASSINGGVGWYQETQGGLNGDGRYWGSANIIRTQNLLFTLNMNNSNNAQIAFKWNDLSGNANGGQPSFVVDDIFVKACPFEGIIGSDSVALGVFEWAPQKNKTQTTLTVSGSVNYPCSCTEFQWEQSTDLGNSWSIIPGATNIQYTTPPNLTSITYYRCKVSFSTGCPGVYQDEA
ncbi:MAG: hypothetical protein GX259_07130, partial [Bacteroidales bacterium]|nr:hypothetical protein [Bacteroidales bacterium]